MKLLHLNVSWVLNTLDYSFIFKALEPTVTFSLPGKGNANWPPQNNYTVMVHFPQITLREWIHSFLRVMKLLDAPNQKEKSVPGKRFSYRLNSLFMSLTCQP